MFITAQIIGFIGLLIGVYSFQKNSRKEILFFQSISTIVFTIHFFLLSAYTGSFLNLSSSVRNVIFYNSHKKWAGSKIWIIVFAMIFSAIGVLTWKNIFSLFPVIACVLQSITFWLKNPKYIRRLTIPCSLCWMIYNIVNLSFAGILTEAISLSSIVIAMFRFDISKKIVAK